MNESNETAPQTLEAGELILRDPSGKVGARLTASPIGSKLALYGESGEERVSVSVLGEQPGVILHDAKGKARATLTVGDYGPLLALHDTGGTLRAALCIGRDEPLLYLYDANGKPRALLGVMFEEGVLHLTDASGKRSMALGYTHTESFFGYAALVCWAALLLLAPAIVHADPGGPMGLVGGALALGGIVLAALWVRHRWRWWKTKGRAMAAYLADSGTHGR